MRRNRVVSIGLVVLGCGGGSPITENDDDPTSVRVTILADSVYNVVGEYVIDAINGTAISQSQFAYVAPCDVLTGGEGVNSVSITSAATIELSRDSSFNYDQPSLELCLSIGGNVTGGNSLRRLIGTYSVSGGRSEDISFSTTDSATSGGSVISGFAIGAAGFRVRVSGDTLIRPARIRVTVDNFGSSNRVEWTRQFTVTFRPSAVSPGG